MPYTSLNGRQVSYGDSGPGVPVVLIHGSFSTSSAWKRIVANLDANRARALTPDLPGWGDSDPAHEDCSDLGDYHAAAVEVALGWIGHLRRDVINRSCRHCSGHGSEHT